MVYFNGENIIKGEFPNGEHEYREVLYLGEEPTITVIYKDNRDLFDALLYKKYLDDTFGAFACVDLHIDFMPYGQQDRYMNNGSIFSFKYFAQLINDAKFETVYICDPHSIVMPACIDRCVVYNIRDLIEDALPYPAMLKEYDMLFYPDNGAAKKYSEQLKGFPYRFGNKKRNLNTGEILCYEVIADETDIKDKKILIIDDLIINGGTYKNAAKALKEMGAKQVDLYITHIMPTKGGKEFYENRYGYGIDNYYSVNTLKVDWFNDKIDI